jgi:hypothetical protein
MQESANGRTARCCRAVCLQMAHRDILHRDTNSVATGGVADISRQAGSAGYVADDPLPDIGSHRLGLPLGRKLEVLRGVGKCIEGASSSR